MCSKHRWPNTYVSHCAGKHLSRTTSHKQRWQRCHDQSCRSDSCELHPQLLTMWTQVSNAEFLTNFSPAWCVWTMRHTQSPSRSPVKMGSSLIHSKLDCNVSVVRDIMHVAYVHPSKTQTATRTSMLTTTSPRSEHPLFAKQCFRDACRKLAQTHSARGRGNSLNSLTVQQLAVSFAARIEPYSPPLVEL